MNFKDAKVIEDLIWYDGPILSLFEQEEKKYLILWCDLIELEGQQTHKWLAVEVPRPLLQEYFDRKTSLLGVMEKSPMICVGFGQFIGSGIECDQILFSEISENDRPTADSFYFGDEGRVA